MRWAIPVLLACAVAAAPAQQTALGEAAAAIERGDLAAAQQKLRAELAAHPNNAAALGLLGVALDGAQKFPEAEQAYKHALAIEPRSPRLLNNYGNHLLARGDAGGARDVFAKLVAIEPAHVNANLQLARLELDRKDAAAALVSLGRLPAEVQSAPQVGLLRVRALYGAGRHAEADKLLERVTSAAPEDARMNFSAGLELAAAGQYEKAESFFSRALKTEPANFEVLYNLGLAALHAGHAARARDVLETALRQRPADVDTLYNLAAAEAALKQESAAVRHLALAARTAPARADVQLLLARTTFNMGYRADALLAFDRYLKLVPSDETARRDRAFTAVLTGRPEGCIPELEQYAKRHPEDAAGHYQLAVALSAAEAERAQAEFGRALELDPNLVAARFGRGVLNYRLGKAQAALPDLEFAADKQPGNARVLDRLGQTYMALDRPADAVRVLESARELSPQNSTILLHLGRALANAGRGDESKAVIAQFRAAGPSRDDMRKPAGLIEFMSRTTAEQDAEYRARVEHDAEAAPHDAAAQMRYLKLLLADGHTAEASTQARALMALHPTAAMLADAGRALLDAGQYGLAQEVLDAAARSGSAPDVELDSAIATFHGVSPQAGLARMDRITEVQRGGDYYLARAQMLDAAGQLEPAVAALNRALRAAPKRAQLYREATLFLIKNNRLDAALNLLDQAAKILPENPEILLTKATTLELAHKTEEAERLLNEIQNRWPEWHPGWLAHGIILDTHKRYDEARQMLDVAVTLGARGAEAYFYLADATLRTSPERIAEAEEAIRQALELTPSDPWALALAGRIAFERKDYPRAIELLREGLRVRPGMAQAHYHLAQAYSATGRKDEAQAELDQLRSIREKYPMADEAPADVLGAIFQVRPPQE